MQARKRNTGVILLAVLIAVAAVQTYWILQQKKEIKHLKKMQIENSGSNADVASVLSAWDPFSEMEAIRQRMNDLFNDSFWRGVHSTNLPSQWSASMAHFHPSFDMEENEKAYVIHGDLPGLDKDHLQVVLRDQVLTIGGKREITNASKDKRGPYTFERGFGSFSRSFVIPSAVDDSQMKADYKNGVLTVMVPKKQPSTAQSSAGVTVPIN